MNWHSRKHHCRPSIEHLEERKLLSGTESVPVATASPEIFDIRDGFHLHEAQGVAFLAGTDSSPAQLAIFSAEPYQIPPGLYTYTLNWGDGTAPSLGEIRPSFAATGAVSSVGTGPIAGPVVYRILGLHEYDQTGSFTVNVTIHAPDGTLATATDRVDVSPSPIASKAALSAIRIGEALVRPLVANLNVGETSAQLRVRAAVRVHAIKDRVSISIAEHALVRGEDVARARILTQFFGSTRPRPRPRTT